MHAPVRPGRCNQKVHFGYASEEICIKIFEHLYTKTPDEMLESRRETRLACGYVVGFSEIKRSRAIEKCRKPRDPR
jgi:hypothetical protein